MKSLNNIELRALYLGFFHSKGHSIIPSASLFPKNDHSVLFTPAGMHPLIPYLVGEKHPDGVRLANVQKVVRTGVIDKIGSDSYCTFFELLGNWSLGDYFKKEAIAYSWEFLTDKRYLDFDKNKLYLTCFEGDGIIPKDVDSYQGWLDMGVDHSHIYYLHYNRKGPYGKIGLSGPNTKVFYDTGKPSCGSDCIPSSCSCGKYLEIWDIVFLEYCELCGKKVAPLTQKNVDTGMSLERILSILQSAESVYDTDVFSSIIACINRLSNKNYKDSLEVTRAFRIVADHIRCATFIMGDMHGIAPSNKGQGYVLRRLIRRAIRFANQLEMRDNSLSEVVEAVITQFGDIYTELKKNQRFILTELVLEEKRFQHTLIKGMREFERIKGKYNAGDIMDAATALYLYETFGFPIEFTRELAEECGFQVDTVGLIVNQNKPRVSL